MIEHYGQSDDTSQNIRIIFRSLVPHSENHYETLDDRYLSSTEKARAARFVFPRDRWSYCAAHSLLRTLLAEFHGVPPLDWQFRNNAHGRPELDPDHHGPDAPRFNISHTHGRVAVAITHGPIPAGLEVGVDAECVERTADVLGLARRFLSKVESDWLQGLPASEHHTQFLRLWTLKEAVAKAVGLGLSLNFQKFHCSFDPLSVVFDEPCWGGPEYWSLYNEWVAPGHWVSMAVRCPPSVPIEYEIEHLCG